MFPPPVPEASAPPLAARNVGHGHVFARPDGRRARCGGPALCPECSKDATLLAARDADAAVAVGRLRAVVALLEDPGARPPRAVVLEHLRAALADLGPALPPEAPDAPDAPEPAGTTHP